MDCERPTTVAALEEQIGVAEQAFVALDVSTFNNARRSAASTLSCEGELVPAGDVARYHRVVALGAFVDRQDERALAAFRSALVADPQIGLPGSFPPGHPLFVLLDTARNTPNGAVGSVVVPQGLVGYVDGSRTVIAATDRPLLVQVTDATGHVLFTGYDQPLPDLSSYVVAAHADDPAPIGPTGPKEHKDKKRFPLVPVAGAGVAALAGVGLYAASAGSASAYADPNTAYEDLDGLTRTNHVLVGSSAALGVVAVGLGVTAAVSW